MSFCKEGFSVNGLRRGFVYNLLRFSVPTLVSAFAAIAIIPLVSHLLPADEYAKANLFCDYGSLLSILLLAGTDGAYIRFFHEVQDGRSRRMLFTKALATGLLSCIILSLPVILVFGNEVSTSLFGTDSKIPLVMLAGYTSSLIVYRLTSSGARLASNAKRYNVFQVSYILINRLLYCFPMFLFGTYGSAILFLTIAMLALSGFSLLTDVHPIFCFSSSEQKMVSYTTMIRYGMPNILMAVLLSLMSATNKTILANNGSFAEAGVYAMALTIANVFAFFPAAFGTYWSVYMYQNYKTHKRQICAMHDFTMVLSVILVTIIFLVQDVFYLAVGGEYKASQPYFMLVMLWPVQSFLSETTSYGINLSSKTYLTLASSLVVWIMSFALCFLLVPCWGGMGAAIAFASGSIIVFVMRTLFAQRFYRTIMDFRRFAVSGVSIVALCAANIVLWSNFPVRLIVSLAAVLFACFVYRKRMSELCQMIKEALFGKDNPAHD